MQSNQMCDDDNIDDVLEKVTIKDALQELFQNQEKLRVALISILDMVELYFNLNLFGYPVE